MKRNIAKNTLSFWSNEIVYCHPMFDMHIGNFVEKCAKEKCLSVMLIPASTHTRYFQKEYGDWFVKNGDKLLGIKIKQS